MPLSLQPLRQIVELIEIAIADADDAAFAARIDADHQAERVGQALFQRQRVLRFKSFERVALRKLRQLDAATELRDLMSPPGNRLEALRGDRQGQHSIRINDQWRICFVWKNGDAFEVEITDYH